MICGYDRSPEFIFLVTIAAQSSYDLWLRLEPRVHMICGYDWSPEFIWRVVTFLANLAELLARMFTQTQTEIFGCLR